MIIYKPNTNHAGDTFREMLDLWEEAGLCELRISPDNFVWVNEPGDILLYDHPRLDDKQIPKFNFGLFGNTVPNCDNCYPWIFWGRKPRLMIDFEGGGKVYSERDISTIFLGKIETSIQHISRTRHDWSKSIDVFEMPINQPRKYTHSEYLEMLSRSKFGLCLPGFGPKCNREIELMCLGVVPIITPGVDLTYYNSLSEGVHYIMVNNPSEIKNKIDLSPDKWEIMSHNCMMWYNENCSVSGSFKTTKEIIKSI